jgi:hypothetical protein
MYTITGGGSFTRTNIDQINANFQEVSSASGGSTSATGLSVWVRPSYGNNNNLGTYDRPFATISGAARAMEPGLTIFAQGVIREEYTGPIVNDISIVGAANQPRQATTSGVANGGGATWLSPSGGTGTLLKITGQAWKIQNIFFNNTATGATTSCVHLDCIGDPPLEADASHAQILGCVMQGANFGVYAPLGPNYVTIAGCTFSNFADTGDTAIKAAQSIRTLLGWKVIGNTFYNNVNHMVAALSRGTVTENNFIVVGNSLTTTIACSLTGGAANAVYGNAFNRPTATSPNATLYVGGTGDVWGANVGTDNFFWDVPDNS